MNALLLGGNSQHNQEWIHKVGTILSPEFHKLLIHDYSHWDGQGGFIDFDLELLRLSAIIEGAVPYIVFAKSVGSILTLKAISKGILKPVGCIFAGLPIKLAEEDKIPLPDLLRDNPVKTLFIQNTNDPLASFSKLVKYLRTAGATNYQALELEGNAHSYDDFERLKSLVHSFTDGTE